MYFVRGQLITQQKPSDTHEILQQIIRNVAAVLENSHKSLRSSWYLCEASVLSAENFGTILKFAAVANPPPHPIQELVVQCPLKGK